MQITNIQNINFNAHHKNVTKPILPPNTITIRNFHEVDETFKVLLPSNIERVQMKEKFAEAVLEKVYTFLLFV